MDGLKKGGQWGEDSSSKQTNSKGDSSVIEAR